MPNNALQSYEVKSGDSIWKIAATYDGMENASNAEIQQLADEIIAANGLENGTAANNLAIGQALILPEMSDLDLSDPVLVADWGALDQNTSYRVSLRMNAPTLTL